MKLRSVGTLRRSRTPTVVLTVRNFAITRSNASSPVARQAYSFQWVSGQKPRLTKDEEDHQLQERTTSSLLSFQGYPPILECSFVLCTSPSHRTRREERVEHSTLETGRRLRFKFIFKVQSKSEVTKWHPETGANPSKIRNKKKKRDDNKKSDDALADLLE